MSITHFMVTSSLLTFEVSDGSVDLSQLSFVQDIRPFICFGKRCSIPDTIPGELLGEAFRYLRG